MARSSGEVIRVSKPKIDEPEPVPIPGEIDISCVIYSTEILGLKPGALLRMYIIVVLSEIMYSYYYMPKIHNIKW